MKVLDASRAKPVGDVAPGEVPVTSTTLVEPDAPVVTSGFENPSSSANATVARLAPQHTYAERLRGKTFTWLAMMGGRAVAIAAALWATGCATTSTAPKRRAPPPPPNERMSQLAHDDWLGNGERRTIAQAGCFMTSLAMASEAMTNRDWDPVRANDAIKKAGGFSGPALELDEATRALGLKVTWRGRLTTSSTTARHAALSQHLAANRVAVAAVDFRDGASSGESEGDHFIMVYAQRGESFFAVDPLGGRLVELTRGDDGFLSYGDDPRYRVCEICLLAPRLQQ
ncbi:MAG: hypothetical protein RIT81_21545 [Deltaproteobacteria bacterium]